MIIAEIICKFNKKYIQIAKLHTIQYTNTTQQCTFVYNRECILEYICIQNVLYYWFKHFIHSTSNIWSEYWNIIKINRLTVPKMFFFNHFAIPFNQRFNIDQGQTKIVPIDLFYTFATSLFSGLLIAPRHGPPATHFEYILAFHSLSYPNSFNFVSHQYIQYFENVLAVRANPPDDRKTKAEKKANHRATYLSGLFVF